MSAHRIVIDRRVVSDRRQKILWPIVDERRADSVYGRRAEDGVEELPQSDPEDRPHVWPDAPTTGFLA